MSSFNLIEEHWLPCITSDGQRKELGIQEAIIKAHTLRELHDASPLVTASLHRLLLAILHRVFGPRSVADWQKLWRAGHFDPLPLDEYFRIWNGKNRFNLFDPAHPFYQSATLPLSYQDPKTGKVDSYQKPIANLVHELASGDNATLFDHTTEASPKAISPAEAARLLVAFQSFAVGGLLTLEKGQDPKRYKSADNAPVVKGAVTLVRGANLFETLMLNLHGEPFDTEGEDMPVWERDEQTIAEDRRPNGYIDLLTWQSRRIRLQPEADERGTVIKRVVIMKGNQFPDGYHRLGKETMIAFTKNEQAKPKEDPWPAIAFQENKALWRDSLSLFQSLEGKQARPKIVDWLNDLADNEIIPWSATYQLSVLGLSTSRAKIHFWRHEHLPLPMAYFDNKQYLDDLSECLKYAEDTDKALSTATWVLARGLADDKDSPKNIAKHLGVTSIFWSQLEQPFYGIMKEIPDDSNTALDKWVNLLWQTAWQAFQKGTRGLGHSARTLKALVAARGVLGARLNKVLPKEMNND